MIASLKGQILSIEKESLVLEVNNVGYEIFCSQNILSEVFEGDIKRFLIFSHVREDQFTLFGFLSKKEKRFFLSLLKVNGIGPKLALNILSAAPTEKLIEMIEAGDVKKLTSLPKVGKKKAEQIILSLKGQLVMAEETEKFQNKNKEEITWALVHLGYKSTDVDKIVADFSADIAVDEGVRVGLQHLSGQI